MRLLELFCGTKSVGKVARKMGHDVVSVDILSKFEPDVCCDILDFDYKAYPVGHFDFIWASPPCTEFSRAKTRGVRNIASAVKIVERTLEIINYLQPKNFCIENPVGLLRKQPCMEAYRDYETIVSYCKYGFKYRKDTNLWTNVKFCGRRCIKGSYCSYRETHGIHSCSVQASGHYVDGKRIPQDAVGSLTERYAVPTELIETLLNSR